MARTIFRFARLAVLAWGVALHAQDAGMVLRTSVGYNTQKGSLPLTDEQRRQADQLGQQAPAAGLAGKYGDALRYYFQGIAVMRNVPWTPAFEFASSLQGRLDHALVEPGKAVTVTLAPLYTGTRTPEKPVTASVYFRTGPAEKSLGPAVAVNPAALPFTTRIALPDATAGDYTIEVRLAAEGETPVAAARAGLVKSLPIHVEALSDAANRLRDRLAKTGRKNSPALPTAEYALELYERVDDEIALPADGHGLISP